MRKLLKKNNQAQMGMVGAAVGLFITLIIAVLIYFSIVGSMDFETLDTGATITNGSWVSGPAPAWNATQQVNSQASTFFTIAPICGIVIVAVVVIGYVQRIGGA